MTKDILIKFLNNSCSDAELDEIVTWVNTKEAFNDESKMWGLNEWNSFEGNDEKESDEKFRNLFDRIQQKIESEKDEHQHYRTSRLSLITTWVTRVAAILLIPVLIFLFYHLPEERLQHMVKADLVVDSLEIIAPIGSRALVQLSDGSEVYLNYGSKLKYPQSFSGDTREVILTGEGFFNVAHNPEKPFIVKAGNLKIKALGTAFNALAYPDEDIIETTLINGKVVLEHDANGQTKTIGSMVPGEHVKYNKRESTISYSKGSVERYIAWKDGKLVFEDATLTQVLDRLSRMFNVDFEVDDSIKDFPYTVTFVDEPLFQILDLMTIATPVSYRALPREKLPDGTFSKQKIIIESNSKTKINL